MSKVTSLPATTFLQTGPEQGLGLLRVKDASLLLNWSALRGNLCLCGILLLVFSIALMAGPQWLTPQQLWQAWSPPLGTATATQMMVLEFRLPRVLLAMLAGAALALAGLLLQILTRNRLASPDMLGLSDGAGLALLCAVAMPFFADANLPWFGPIGALAAAALLLCLLGDWRHHNTERLLLGGLALASLLRALLELALARQDIAHASALYAWSMGHLGARTGNGLGALASALALSLFLLAIGKRQINLLRLDLALAANLGLAVRRWQVLVLILALLLAGLAIGLCGALAFVALAAPLIAQRLLALGNGSAHAPALLASCQVGAILVLLADTLGRCLLVQAELPAGVICNLLGGPFLLCLLLANRDKS